MSTQMWGEAILSACYILNRVPHKRLDKTPYELWKGFAPNLNFLKVWGCLAKVALPDFKRTNVGTKTFDCVFIGYAQNSAAYRFLRLNDNSICESRNAEFFEQEFPLTKHVNELISSCNTTSVPLHLRTSSSVTNEQVNEPRRSKRKRIESSFGPDFVTAFVVENNDVDKINDVFVSTFLIEEDPKTYNEAVTSIDANFWKEAINSELDSIMYNHTWDLVDLPKGSKPIRCKWIFRKKLRTDGTIDKFKARLVVVGYTQKKEIDYFDTYSPVTKISTIRSLVALAAIHGLIVHQMDVKTAFLNGDLREEIYVEQPEGYVIQGQENKVCKLRKSLYGLKQAPKQWYEKFDQTLVSDGYIVNSSDTCVYSKLFGQECVIICLYVDDMLIFGTNVTVVEKTKLFLSSHFDMKDLGEADVILGVKMRKSDNGFSLCQSHYIEKILKKFNCYDELPVRTPYDPSIHLKKNNGSSVSQTEYAKIIGSVMFLMNCTRPDIAYAVSRLSRYTHNPGNEHWTALRRLLRYLKGTMDWCLHFYKFPAVLEGFCDANWVTDNDEVSSTSGYVFTLGGGAISWKSSKQTCIARSTMESEFIALDLAGQEAEWLRNLLADVPLWGKRSIPVSLHCDSEAAIGIAKNSVYNGKRRHIRIRHSSVRELLKNGVISLQFVRSENNLADPFTKGLTKKVVLESSRGMGLKPLC